MTTWVEPGPATIRSLAQGDRVAPLGGVGARPVRRLLMEARVSRAERRNYPIVERDGRVLWVPGICRAAFGVPDKGTKAIKIDVIKV